MKKYEIVNFKIDKFSGEAIFVSKNKKKSIITLIPIIDNKCHFKFKINYKEIKLLERKSFREVIQMLDTDCEKLSKYIEIYLKNERKKNR